MMVLSEDVRLALNERFKHHFGNVAGLAQPVLIIFDYSPTDSDPPLSIAFDGELGPKCWMSEPTVEEIDGDGPNVGSYAGFRFERRDFYGYSIQVIPQSTFNGIDEICEVCRRLYAHIVWSDS